MPVPTNAPCFVAAAAASLAAAEVCKLVAADEANAGVGAEVMLDLRHHTHHVSRLERNPDCRFHHAEPWSIETVRNLSVGEALGLAGHGEAALRVEGTPFVSKLLCAACGHAEDFWHLRVRLDAETLACPRCGAARSLRGFDLVGQLSGADVPAGVLGRRLSDLGLRPGDVFSVVGPGGAGHFEIDVEGVSDAATPESPGVLLAGVGAIGSFLAPLLARNDDLGSVGLCDPDRYEPGQEHSQNIDSGDIGRKKVEVQAEALRRIDPRIGVRIFPTPLEDLTLGALRHRIAVSALDSLGARLHLAQMAWRVGSPFVDSAVDCEHWLARVNVYLPRPDAPCFQCSMEPADYEQLEQVHACGSARAKE